MPLDPILFLSETVDGRWRPGIGDPTAIGWISVAAYLAAAWLCARTAMRGSPREMGPRWFWWSIAIAMVLLAINKQLDLQSWLTQTAKDLSKDQGWYERRRPVQFAFVIAIGLVGIAGATFTAWSLRRTWRRTALAIAGLFAITTYVVVRASSFHHLDEFITWSPGGIRMNWVLELGGLALLGAGAAHACRTTDKSL